MERFLNSKKYPDFLKFQLPVLIWMALIYTLSSMRGSTYSPFEFPEAHLIAHSLLFGMLYYLGYRALRYQNFSRFLSEFSLVMTLFFVILYAAADEYHQSFVPGRTEDIKDLLVDTTAAVVVLFVVLLKDKLRPKERNWGTP